MKLVALSSGVITVVDVPAPVSDHNEVLVANAYSAISVGTELSMIAGSKSPSLPAALKQPALIRRSLNYVRKRGIKATLSAAKELRETTTTLGYSTAGIVIAAGKYVTDVGIGDRVSCAGGKANHAEIVSVPRNLVTKIPEGVSFEEAAFAALGAIAMQGIRRAGTHPFETIVILGVGLIGQLAVQIAKAAGYKVIAVDRTPDRVNFAAEMGADLSLVVGKHDVKEEVLSYTRGLGADAVAIYAATRSSKPVNQAMRMVRKGGKVVVIGSVGMNLERQPFYEREADFLISRSYGPGRYDPIYEEKGIDYPIEYVRWTENRNMQAFLALLQERRVDVNPLVSGVFHIEEAEKAYSLLVRGKKRTLGILLKYDPAIRFSKTGKIALPQRAIEVSPRVIEGKINVALIGAGRFARGLLLPLISEIPDYNLRAIVSATGTNAKQTALRYKAEYCTTDYKEVLDDQKLDLVFITTPHNLHYPMIVDAAKAGKAIYVEKPMCLSEDQLDSIVKIVSETKTPLVVGFNRRYAPLIRKAKELLIRKHRPYVINCRVNAGFIPKTHWVHDPEVGGGRIIGECCHFFDLFNYLIESDVEHVTVEAVPVNNCKVVSNDNAAVTMRWKDGSVSVLTYTSLGHADLPKERMEIFADGSGIIVDDLREMLLYGFEEKHFRLKKQDKGHCQQLVELSKFLRGECSEIISFQECVKTMRITFETEKLMRNLDEV